MFHLSRRVGVRWNVHVSPDPSCASGANYNFTIDSLPDAAHTGIGERPRDWLSHHVTTAGSSGGAVIVNNG